MKFDTRLRENLELWFENKKILKKEDFDMIKKFTHKTENK